MRAEAPRGATRLRTASCAETTLVPPRSSSPTPAVLHHDPSKTPAECTVLRALRSYMSEVGRSGDEGPSSCQHPLDTKTIKKSKYLAPLKWH
jgi:hypothetical protein